MRWMPHLKRVLVGSAFAGAFFIGAPAAGAAELPNPVIDSAGFVEHVRGELSSVGVQTPQVDVQVTDAVDDALQKVVPQNTPALPQPEAPQAPQETAASELPAASEIQEFATQAYDQTEALTNPNPIGLQEIGRAHV